MPLCIQTAPALDGEPYRGTGNPAQLAACTSQHFCLYLQSGSAQGFDPSPDPYTLPRLPFMGKVHQ